MSDYLSKYTGPIIDEAIGKILAFDPNIIAVKELVSTEGEPYDLDELIKTGMYTVSYSNAYGYEGTDIAKGYIIYVVESDNKIYQYIDKLNKVISRSIPNTESSFTGVPFTDMETDESGFNKSDESNLDNITVDGRYELSGDVDNAVFNMNTLHPQYLYMSSNGDIKVQILETGQYKYMRKYDGTSWGEWVDITDSTPCSSTETDPFDLNDLTEPGEYIVDYIKDPYGLMNSERPQKIYLTSTNDGGKSMYVTVGSNEYKRDYNTETGEWGEWYLISGDSVSNSLMIRDSVTGKNYIFGVANGMIFIQRVLSDVTPSDIILIDSITGKRSQIILEDGRLYTVEL